MIKKFNKIKIYCFFVWAGGRDRKIGNIGVYLTEPEQMPSQGKVFTRASPSLN